MADTIKKKNPFQKLKEGLDDKEEQLAIISLFVRLGVVVWSGFIVTLNYITIPGYSSEPKDITFPELPALAVLPERCLYAFPFSGGS